VLEKQINVNHYILFVSSFIEKVIRLREREREKGTMNESLYKVHKYLTQKK